LWTDTLDHSANFVINIALRSAAVAFLILIAATLWRDHSRSLAARLGTAFTLGVASFAVSSTAGFGRAHLVASAVDRARNR
jgi:hypothetical protein